MQYIMTISNQPNTFSLTDWAIKHKKSENFRLEILEEISYRITEDIFLKNHYDEEKRIYRLPYKDVHIFISVHIAYHKEIYFSIKAYKNQDKHEGVIRRFFRPKGDNDEYDLLRMKNVVQDLENEINVIGKKTRIKGYQMNQIKDLRAYIQNTLSVDKHSFNVSFVNSGDEHSLLHFTLHNLTEEDIKFLVDMWSLVKKGKQHG